MLFSTCDAVTWSMVTDSFVLSGIFQSRLMRCRMLEHQQRHLTHTFRLSDPLKGLIWIPRLRTPYRLSPYRARHFVRLYHQFTHQAMRTRRLRTTSSYTGEANHSQTRLQVRHRAPHPGPFPTKRFLLGDPDPRAPVGALHRDTTKFGETKWTTRALRDPRVRAMRGGLRAGSGGLVPEPRRISRTSRNERHRMTLFVGMYVAEVRL